MQSIVKVGWGKSDPKFRRVFTTLFVPGATEEQKGWFDELMRISTTPEMAVRLRSAWGEVDITDLLCECQTPTLVAHARDEVAVPFEEGRLIAARIPNPRLLPLESRNHVLLPDEPAWPVFVSEILRFLGEAPAPAPIMDELSPRELEVLRLVARGLSNDKVAGRLYLSPRTVERHLSNIYAKLGLSGKSARAGAAALLSELDSA